MSPTARIEDDAIVHEAGRIFQSMQGRGLSAAQSAGALMAALCAIAHLAGWSQASFEEFVLGTIRATAEGMPWSGRDVQ